jgi:hypothetical protein
MCIHAAAYIYIYFCAIWFFLVKFKKKIKKEFLFLYHILACSRLKSQPAGLPLLYLRRCAAAFGPCFNVPAKAAAAAQQALVRLLSLGLHCWRCGPTLQCHPLPQATHESNTCPGSRHLPSPYLLQIGVLLRPRHYKNRARARAAPFQP